MAFRVSFVWKASQDKDAGWTENFWWNADVLADAVAGVQAMYPLLKALHGDQSVCKRVRVAGADGGRVGKLVRFRSDAAGPVNGTNDTDLVTTALSLELSGNPEGTTLQWLKGIPDTQVTRGGTMQLTGPYIAAFNAFQRELTLGTRKWSVRISATAGDFKYIENVDANGNLTVPAHGIVNITTVKIKGVRTPTGVTGDRTVRPVDSNTLQILGWKPHFPFSYDGLGFFREQGFLYFPIGTAELVEATKKNVGAPSGVFIGRRKRARI